MSATGSKADTTAHVRNGWKADILVTSGSDLDAEARSRLPLGFGCSLVCPVALFGTAMIVDHPGPPGRFGTLEFPGWWGLCVGVSVVSAAFLRRYRDCRGNRYLQLMAAIGVPIAFAFLTFADLHPDTPAEVKRAVEYLLQVLGVPVVGLLVAFCCWTGWNSRRV